MEPKIILYYLALIFFITWAGSLLVRASNDLCRRAEREYQNPNGRPDDAERDEE